MHCRRVTHVTNLATARRSRPARHAAVTLPDEYARRINSPERCMELVFIGFLGTSLLMAVELSDFIRRHIRDAAPKAASAAASAGIGQAKTIRSAATDQDLYDQAA
jgi:hypothetical protein